MERYICIHGHFYQPPRENPWLEAIELQDSAYPYHDWNERITAECYGPNSAARILDSQNHIIRIENNYSKISFNFGPSLLMWMEKETPNVYKAIQKADQDSQVRFSGHGSAMAQPFNHMIMPLATRRDKYTQVLWGMRDFEYRFGRKPEGMWLPETAVDLETLEILVDFGIKFTVLAPRQAARVKPKNGKAWQDVSDERIDPTMPYELRLPSTRSISIFFYDGPISRSVAFEGLLGNGENYANRLLGVFKADDPAPQLVHVATDGETYGHHHRYGEMALAYALKHIEYNQLAKLTNYGEYLEKFPPTHEVQIYENTSWSCIHGVERWRNDCGCNSGMHPRWSQEWRAPLRESLDWMRDKVAVLYEEKGRQYFKDPWMARDEYITVLLNRRPAIINQFFSEQATRELNETDRINALKLLELQRQTMLMYTSCGWFFDDISGIETVQIIQYAGRALQLAEEMGGGDLEAEFNERLEKAKSNISGFKDGRWIYDKFVKTARVDLEKVGAHYAISSLFGEAPEGGMTYSFFVEREDYRMQQVGKTKMAVGRVRVTSSITYETALLAFAVLHMGDHNLSGGVRWYQNPAAYENLVQEFQKAFSRADFPEFIRAMDRSFGSSIYSLKSLFRDQQRHILDSILETTLAGTESVYRQVYENNVPLMRFLADLNAPLPKALQTSAEFIFNTRLRRMFETEEMDFEAIKTLLGEAKIIRIALDVPGLSFVLQHRMERMMAALGDNPHHLEILAGLEAASDIIQIWPFEVNLSKIQNNFYTMLQTLYPENKRNSAEGDRAAEAWCNRFTALAQKLRVRIP